MNRVVSKIVYWSALLSVIITAQACKTSLVPLAEVPNHVVTVSEEHPYTEVFHTKEGEKEMDVELKMEFNDAENALTVSFASAHNLFGFKNNSLYKHVIRDKKISIDRLPYKVQSEQGMSYRLSKKVRNSIPGTNSKHTFKALVSTTGLHPQNSDYIMVTDTLKQKYDIKGDTIITVSLGDIMMMQRSVSKKNRYDIIHYADLDKVYEVIVGRNPCFNKNEEISETETQLEQIKSDYTTLYSKYPSIDKMTVETLQALDDVRVKLEAKYPKVEANSTCPTIQSMQEEYNAYADSIAALANMKAEFAQKRPKLTVSADQLLAVARMVDANVASWLVSNDVVEKSDLVKRNKKLIDDINAKVSRRMHMDREQNRAYITFKKAEKYFYETCLQK